ncbi:DUF2304 domain-containing protein [Microbacterium sp.]|uniref:DUF2304 domain-containing protein n=1 Tax=Microbacterium sp. TaxID=51671 RepID=UPI0039E30C8E
MIAIGALLLGGFILVVIVTMLLRRQLREKYAVLWLVIGIAILALGVFPFALDWLTVALGFQLPANLLFTLAIGLLLAVSIHLSWELSRAEEEVRRLAEESAISRVEREQMRRDISTMQQQLHEISQKEPTNGDG